MVNRAACNARRNRLAQSGGNGALPESMRCLRFVARMMPLLARLVSSLLDDRHLGSPARTSGPTGCTRTRHVHCIVTSSGRQMTSNAHEARMLTPALVGPLALLGLLLALVAFPPTGGPHKRERRPKFELREDAKATPRLLNAVLQLKSPKAAEEDARMASLLPYLLPEDAEEVRRCRTAAARYHDATRGTDFLAGWRCRSPWCATCARIKHETRTAYQVAKISSVNPSPKNALLYVHTVWTLPPELHEIVRNDSRGFDAWMDAIRATIAEVYGYKGTHKGGSAVKNCFRELGMLANVHAWGDSAQPWPKWAPHADVLMPAYRKREGKMQRLPEKWPKLYPITAAIYRRQLATAFLPLALRPIENAGLLAFLKTDFATDWHVTLTSKESQKVLLTSARLVRYSCRQLYMSGDGHVRKDANGEPVLVYRPPANRKRPIVHRVKPGPALGAVRSMQEFVWGENARRYYGIMANRAYADACALAGKPAVKEREKKGVRLKAAYVRRADGSWRLVDPRDVEREVRA